MNNYLQLEKKTKIKNTVFKVVIYFFLAFGQY